MWVLWFDAFLTILSALWWIFRVKGMWYCKTGFKGKIRLGLLCLIHVVTFRGNWSPNFFISNEECLVLQIPKYGMKTQLFSFLRHHLVVKMWNYNFELPVTTSTAIKPPITRSAFSNLYSIVLQSIKLAYDLSIRSFIAESRKSLSMIALFVSIIKTWLSR